MFDIIYYSIYTILYCIPVHSPFIICSTVTVHAKHTPPRHRFTDTARQTKHGTFDTCPGCGKHQRSDNLKRHMGVCKKLKERHLTVTTPAAFKTALDAKHAELAEAKRRIAQLESQSKTTNITVNNHTTINNYLTINVVPLLDSKGDLLEDESLPRITTHSVLEARE